MVKLKIHCPRAGGKMAALITILRFSKDSVCIVPNDEAKNKYPEDVQEQLISPADLRRRGLYIP